MKMTRKDKLALIDAKLDLSLKQFYFSLPLIVRILFKKQALAYYSLGKDDCIRDYKWLLAKIKKIEGTK
jgi:hypothetical protein